MAEEVERLISAGLPRAAAVGAASWTARAWLGLPGLTDGAPADLVVFDEDPVVHRMCCTTRAASSCAARSWPEPAGAYSPRFPPETRSSPAASAAGDDVAFLSREGI